MRHLTALQAHVPLLLSTAFTPACGARGSDIIDGDESDNVSGCVGCDDDEVDALGGDGDPADDNEGLSSGKFGALCDGKSFTLKTEWDGPCEKVDGPIDLNLGNSAEATVRALYCQIVGEEPSAELVSDRARDLVTSSYVRRIDLAWQFCEEAGGGCQLTFSDPWECQVDLQDTCTKKTDREMGAVFMFFSECPGGLNCDPLWANNHSHGMLGNHTLYGTDSKAAGVYHPGNVGFWRREFLDARWAGLQFLLLNTYGPDITAHGGLANASEALDEIGGGIRVGLMDDTWGWREGSPAPFNEVPDLRQHEAAATAIFNAKWKPFFDAIPKEHWYTIEGRPLIYLYNGGTLDHRDQTAPVLTRLKAKFVANFGVDPFVVVDSGFFWDEESLNPVADGRFTWDTFNQGDEPSDFSLQGTRWMHAMVRWDDVGRGRPGEQATPQDRMAKGDSLLISFLDKTKDADFAVLGTWNDLGEGTGISRAFDYYDRGQWQTPHHFMSLIREAQCE